MRSLGLLSVLWIASCGSGVAAGSDGGDAGSGDPDGDVGGGEFDAASREGDRHVPRVPDGLVDVYEACDDARCEGVNLVAAGGGLGWDCIEGEPFGAAFRIASCGTTPPATDTLVSLRFGETVASEATVPAGIPSGKGVWLAFEVPWEVWSPRFGDPVTAYVDLASTVAECREDDNEDPAGAVPECR